MQDRSTTNPTPRFATRAEAGERLALALAEYRGQKVVVAAIPQGGVLVGIPIAKELEAPIAAALVETQHSHRSAVSDRMRGRGRRGSMFDFGGGAASARSKGEVRDASAELRLHGLLPGMVDGQVVIVVDDGLSSDSDVHATLQAVRHMGARTVVLAIPFLTEAARDNHTSEADEVVALHAPAGYFAATEWYGAPEPPTPEVVRELLAGLAGHPVVP